MIFGHKFYKKINNMDFGIDIILLVFLIVIRQNLTI